MGNSLISIVTQKNGMINSKWLPIENETRKKTGLGIFEQRNLRISRTKPFF
jgi:hypothetical protein